MELAAKVCEGGSSPPLYAVVGGFPNEVIISETIKDLIALRPTLLMPGHCTGWRAKQAIETATPGLLAPLTVGTQYDM